MEIKDKGFTIELNSEELKSLQRAVKHFVEGSECQDSTTYEVSRVLHNIAIK